MTLFQTIFLYITTIFFAAIMGAYYGTIDYRIKHDLPLITSHCYCPNCNHKLKLTHQIPILSWVFLRGRCAYCNNTISFRYPMIEGIFIIFYSISYIIFFKLPLIAISLWFLFYTTILVLRCNKHYLSMLKGFFIMTLYHLIYSGLIMIIHATT